MSFLNTVVKAAGLEWPRSKAIVVTASPASRRGTADSRQARRFQAEAKAGLVPDEPGESAAAQAQRPAPEVDRVLRRRPLDEAPAASRQPRVAGKGKVERQHRRQANFVDQQGQDPAGTASRIVFGGRIHRQDQELAQQGRHAQNLALLRHAARRPLVETDAARRHLVRAGLIGGARCGGRPRAGHRAQDDPQRQARARGLPASAWDLRPSPCSGGRWCRSCSSWCHSPS